MIIEEKWEYLRCKNSTRDILNCFAHYFQLNLDETYFLCNEVELKVVRSKYKPLQEEKCSDSRFSTTVLRVGIVAGMNGPVIFLEKGTNVHPRIRDNNLVARKGLPEGSCVIPKKTCIHG